MSRSTCSARSVPATRRFALESLENRALMAGDITFNVVGGNLFINGDNAANGLQIGQVAPNQFALVGTVQGGANTTVQGAKFQIASGVTGSVFMNMNGGDDAVKVEDGPVPLTSPVQQAGLPRNFQFPKFTQNVQINLGTGADAFVTEGMQVQGRMILDTGFGNEADTIHAERLIVRAQNTGGLGLEIDTNGGNDRVELIDNTISGLVDIDTGTEDDLVEIVGILVNLEADVRIRTQNGNDNVVIEDALLDGSLDIETGFGQDVAILRDIVVESLDADMGGDNDILEIEEIIADLADFNGNQGTDGFIDLGDNQTGVRTDRNFEIVVD